MLFFCALLIGVAAGGAATCSSTAAQAPWSWVGPTSYSGGDGLPGPNAGAVQQIILLHGGPAALAASTNGGVWKTESIEGNAVAASVASPL